MTSVGTKTSGIAASTASRVQCFLMLTILHVFWNQSRCPSIFFKDIFLSFKAFFAKICFYVKNLKMVLLRGEFFLPIGHSKYQFE